MGWKFVASSWLEPWPKHGQFNSCCRIHFVNFGNSSWFSTGPLPVFLVILKRFNCGKASWHQMDHYLSLEGGGCWSKGPGGYRINSSGIMMVNGLKLWGQAVENSQLEREAELRFTFLGEGSSSQEKLFISWILYLPMTMWPKHNYGLKWPKLVPKSEQI